MSGLCGRKRWKALLVVVAAALVGASTAPSDAPAAAARRRFTAALTGDTLVHSPLWAQAKRNAGGSGFDFDPMLARLAPLVGSVDLGVCHLETPIAPRGERPSTFPLYGVPWQVVRAIHRAGYDRCSTASNHVIDRGVAGIERTVDVLERFGLGQSGMARWPREIRPRTFRVAGVKVSHLSYTFGYNGLRLPPGQRWRSALIDPARIVRDARRARDRGAEVVIVSMHWGVEGIATPTPAQRDVADRITASGAIDLVVGHHAHVLQPIERVNGTWVIYGLGNILSNLPTGPSWPASTQDGAVVVVGFSVAIDGRVRVARPVIHPTWVDRQHGWVVRLVQRDLARHRIKPMLRAKLTASLARTERVLGPFIAAPP